MDVGSHVPTPRPRRQQGGPSNRSPDGATAGRAAWSGAGPEIKSGSPSRCRRRRRWFMVPRSCSRRRQRHSGVANGVLCVVSLWPAAVLQFARGIQRLLRASGQTQQKGWCCDLHDGSDASSRVCVSHGQDVGWPRLMCVSASACVPQCLHLLPALLVRGQRPGPLRASIFLWAFHGPPFLSERQHEQNMDYGAVCRSFSAKTKLQHDTWRATKPLAPPMSK